MLTCAVLGSLSISLAGPVDAIAFTPVDSPSSTRYFDTRVELDVDPGWIVIHGGTPMANARVLDAADRWGLDLSQAVASGVKGWTYVPVPGGDADRIVRRLAAAIPSLYVSPLFLAGTEQLPWVPMNEMIVQVQGEGHLDGYHILEYDLGGHSGMLRVGLNESTAFGVLKQVDRVASRPGVVWAQPNAIWWAKQSYTPNDPDYASQWALNQSNDMDMDAPECWDTTFGDASIKVAILDDGIDQDHPDISQVPGNDFTNGNTGGNHITACDGHGSCVGGCVSATIDNNLGVVGVAPGCRVVAAKIFNAIDFFGFCLGFIETTDAWIVNGIGWAASSGARVTNSSWGGGSPSSALTTAFQQSRASGVVHFGAAGNDGSSTISYPASLSELYAVSAINSSGSLASFSTYGTGLFCSAPGEGILTTDWVGSGGFSGGDYVTIDGTSFASPYAAGVAALVLSMDPSLTPDEVGDIMAASCTDRGNAGYDTSYGWGIVNAAAAVEAVDPADDCLGDSNGDGVVGTDDLLDAIANWGVCGDSCESDVNGDGLINTDDILAMISNWGPCV
jgi:subtilisin family serine protease